MICYNNMAVGSDGMSDKNMKKRSDNIEIVKAFSMVLQLGISIMVPIALCLFVGYELDKFFETGFITVIFVFLGMAAGIKSVYTITKGFYSKDLEREKKEQQYYDELYCRRREAQSDKDNRKP